jgi:diaminopimelate epimerase
MVIPVLRGVNLQWAVAISRAQIVARVFERGEGPTASSGTSAAAVASAFWRLGMVDVGRINVEMPGGTVPLELTERHGCLIRVRLFGAAAPFDLR